MATHHDHADDGRVAAVHRQARPTLAVAAAFTVAAATSVVVPHRTGPWLALHLFFTGALLEAISGATQLLGVTWSASAAPPRRLAAIQRIVLALGALALTTGHERGSIMVAVLGAVLVVSALVMLGVLLIGIRRSRSVDRFLPAIDAYLVAVLLGLLGSCVGALLVSRHQAADSAVETVHATTNLLGVIGIVIAATMPWFAATQARTRMNPRATSSRVRAVVATLAVSVTVADASTLAGVRELAGGALLVYAMGVMSLVALVPNLGHRQLTWAGPRLVQLLAGIAWWAVGVVLLGLDLLHGAPPSLRAVEVLAVAAYGQILAASLAYLGPVLRGGGHRFLGQGFTLTRSWVGLVAANLAGIAALAGSSRLLGVVVLAWIADLVWRAARLLLGPDSPTLRRT